MKQPKPPHEMLTTPRLLGISGCCYLVALVAVIMAAFFIVRLALPSLLSASATNPKIPPVPSPAPASVILSLLGIATFSLFAMAVASIPSVLLRWRDQGLSVQIPDNYCVVLFLHDHKLWVIRGTAFRYRPDRGEKFQPFDLRQQSRLLSFACDTADQIRLNLDIGIQWQHVAETMFAFLDFAGDPQSLIDATLKAEITSQVSKRDYQKVMQEVKMISRDVFAIIQPFGGQCGLNIISVGIQSAKIDASASPAKEEANRLLDLEKVVNKISERTTDYALKSKGIKDDKGKG